MKKYYLVIVLLLFISSCATYKTKYLEGTGLSNTPTNKQVSHTFYLIGDAGLSPMGDMNPALRMFKNRLDKADKNSTAIFLGDNIYPAGLPDPKDDAISYKTAANHMDAQLGTLQNYKGRPLFIPGNHDWYNEGLEGLERQEDYIKEKLKQKDPFLPENGCPLETIEISEDLVVIVIDTKWYLTNWDKHPKMNDKCDIKSRDKFLLELADEIKDNRQRTTLIALHHPIFSYGPHGGQFSFRQQLYPDNGNFPLPFLGSLANLLRKTTGASMEDLQNKRYRELRNRITTLAQYSEKVIFASGHEHTLQYIVEKGLPQIVSGSGAKK
ncbi:metallophosphoesterase [Ulvibacterium sp.]|uniref:metallophosphoesterase n=1 Tax=Ulvibacterium sp. TaxID=2665914 RepID=UPI003CC57AF2